LDVLPDLIVTLVGFSAFAQHIWALRGHFVSDRMSAGARTISVGAVLTCGIMTLLVWSQGQPLLAQVVGAALMASSLLLFWGAVRASRAARLRFAFDDGMPQQLVSSGPYQRIRHPFYASYLVFWLGWALAAWSLLALLPVAIMACLYTIAARHEEALLIRSPLGADYASYRAQAGLFWPRI
jgi:protein-S-isoprenylcysteine O-methyltransferase Ste14